tara:strand:+ start:998 stop:1708 length:711 start_codon:yes stop_codon:yes gene_type:complete
MPRGSTSKEKFKTKHGVFDNFTNATLYKLISRGFFEGMESPISIGKESNVFSAIRKDNSKAIIKIYRLETCDFNRMYSYIQSDPRYPRIKKSRRKIIFNWAQREYRNLLRAREASVPVPTPYGIVNNVFVMEFIGTKQVAPKLKDLPPENPKKFFNNIIDNMIKLHKTKLVHGDLSPFNILNFKESPVFIDFSQGTTTDHPNVEEYLKRDIKNITVFFRKQGLTISDENIYKKITK